MTMLPRLKAILEASGILAGEQTHARLGLQINLLFNLKTIAMGTPPDPELEEACDSAIKLVQAERQRLKEAGAAQPPPAPQP